MVRMRSPRTIRSERSGVRVRELLRVHGQGVHTAPLTGSAVSAAGGNGSATADVGPHKLGGGELFEGEIRDVEMNFFETSASERTAGVRAAALGASVGEQSDVNNRQRERQLAAWAALLQIPGASSTAKMRTGKRSSIEEVNGWLSTSASRLLLGCSRLHRRASSCSRVVPTMLRQCSIANCDTGGAGCFLLLERRG